jgi:hypothetical protein
MKSRVLILYVLLPVLLFSCGSVFDDKEGNGLPLSDERFDGVFNYRVHWKDSKGINENFENTILTFDGTTKGTWRSVWWSYDTYWGWNWSGSKRGDYYQHSIEIEITNGEYRIRKWNSGDEFTNWQPYAFSNDNNTLKLENFDHGGTTKFGSFQKEDELLKGINHIEYRSNDGNSVPGGGYTTGHGEYIPVFHSEFERWNEGYTNKYKYTFSHWNTKTDNTGISYYAGNYLFYNGNNITLYAIWNKQLQRY